MRTIRAIAILAAFVLMLTCTAGMVSAGVEPSPFKSKTIGNRIHAAQNQLGPIESMLDHIEGKTTVLDNKGSIISVTNKVDALPRYGYSSLRTLESARGLFEDHEPIDIGDYSEALEELRKYAEGLQDKIMGMEENPDYPKIIIQALNHLGIIVQDILTVVDEFLGDIYGQNVD